MVCGNLFDKPFAIVFKQHKETNVIEQQFAIKEALHYRFKLPVKLRLVVFVTRRVSVPVCVYDNPGTTHFTFTDELHGRISSLEGVRSVKIPGVPDSPDAAAARVDALRRHLRPDVTIGISGDAYAGLGLNAGCEVGYSVCGGLFPETAKQITEAAAANDYDRVTTLTTRLEPLWALFRKHRGSIRVIAAAAGVLGLTDIDCLPRPLLPLPVDDIAEITDVIRVLELK